MQASGLKSSVIIIIGEGWSGLAAAASLTSRGFKPTVLEAAPQTGGRARSLENMNQQLDNGQHIMLGAYTSMLELLHLLNINPEDVLLRKRLDLKIDYLNKKGLHLKCSSLFSPLHMLTALLSTQGLSWREKGSVIQCWLNISIRRFRCQPDISVQQYLTRHGQSIRLIELFWQPLCLGALNTPITQASMQVFMTVLKRSFTGSRAFSDMLLPSTVLGNVIPAPATEYITRHGGQVKTGERVHEISIDNNACHVATSKGGYRASTLIMATPARQTAALLSCHTDFTKLGNNLRALGQQPITTLYIQYPESVYIDGDMHGLCGTTTQWLVDRRSCGQPGLIAAVISATGPHMDMDKATLTNTILSEVQQVFPHWPQPEDSFLVREKQATFSCTVDINKIRPQTGHIGHNIWLAGDYLATGLPATLEGAVASGLQCARLIMQNA